MGDTTSITSKFQVHIPLEIRKQLNLTKPTKAKIAVLDNKIIIEPLTKETILDLKGKLKHPKGVEIEKIRDQIDYSTL